MNSILIRINIGTNKLNIAKIGNDLGEMWGSKYDNNKAVAKNEFTI